MDGAAVDNSGVFLAHLSRYQLIIFVGAIASVAVFLMNILIIGDLEVGHFHTLTPVFDQKKGRT